MSKNTNLSWEVMSDLIRKGGAYFGVLDKTGENIGAQLSWLSDCLFFRPQSVERQFVIVL